MLLLLPLLVCSSELHHMLRPLLLLLSSRDQQTLPMAVVLFPENWATWEPTPPCPGVISSPRISFSCDLDSADDDQPLRRSDNSPTVDGSPSSSSEFDFCAARGRSEQESSAAADELFSDGVLLPLCLLYKGGSTPAIPTRLDALPNSSTSPTTVTTSSGTSTTVVSSKSGEGGGGGGSGSGSGSSGSSSSPLKCVFVPTTLKATNKKEKQKEAVAAPGNSRAVDDNPTAGKQSSSFWRFRRSSSLNSGGSGEGEGAPAGGRRSSLICSFPLLSRSKSAGSNPVPVTAKPRQQHHLSSTSTPPANALSSSSSGKLSRKGSANGGSGPRNLYYYGQQQHGGAGVRISPVLNVPSPYIPRGSSGGFLSFGHLLCSVKDKRRKKAQLRLPPSP